MSSDISRLLSLSIEALRSGNEEEFDNFILHFSGRRDQVFVI